MCPADIKVKQNSPYTVAVYVADCDKGGRELMIDLFDIETGHIIAPSTRVSDLNGGVYFVFTYDRSVRILCNNLRGDNAVINAIYFDKGPVSSGISNHETEKADDRMFTLSGISVDKDSLADGIYISDGRKFIVR